MQGLIIIATLVALVASFVIISTRKKPAPVPTKHRVRRQPMNICMMKRRALKRQQRREQQHLLLLAFVVQWQYKQARV